jgi:Tol biopolymer transport system component
VDGDIYVAEWDGSSAIRIADGRPPDVWKDGFLIEERCGPGEYHAEGPIWSPDGRYLAYRHTDCEGARDEWWDVLISDREGNIVTSFPSQGWGISWSPDSTLVAVWVDWTHTIGIYGLDGVRQTLLTLPHVIRAGESDPVWLADGESLRLGNFEITERKRATTTPVG